MKLGLALNQKRLFIKNLELTIHDGDNIPHVAYLPTFADIEWHSAALRNRYVGQGLAGAVLRNQKFYLANDQYRREYKNARGRLSDADLRHLREHDPYKLLQQVIFSTLRVGVLYPKEFNPVFHTHVRVNFREGEIVNKRFKPYACGLF